MRAAVYNPYLDTLGGGERYTMAFACVLDKCGYRVDVQWDDASIKKDLESRFGIKLSSLHIVSDIKRGDGYDVCFWVSDGSIPMLRARYNFLHFQIPFKDVNGRTLFNKMKLYRINNIICNSFFTKGFIDEEFGVESDVIYPPVDVERFKSKRKKNVILSIGRFSQLTQAKRQDVLVDAYKKLVDSGKISSDWRLVLAGGTEVGASGFVSKLKKIAKYYPVDIIESPGFKEVVDLYGSAKIFWSASGYGIKEKRDPSRVEHFGITVVEAMSAGCAPLVYSAGGHKEIIESGANGYLWKEKTQLVSRTKELIRDDVLLRKLSKDAKQSSRLYEYKRFEKQVEELFK